MSDIVPYGVLFLVVRGVDRVDVFAVKPILNVTECFTETLEVYYLALTKESYCVLYIRVINKPQDIVIGCACLLFCCELIRRTRCEKPLKTLGFSLAQGF